MIKVENIETYGWEAAIRGMRNPMNSWDKSDSGYGCSLDTNKVCTNCNYDQCSISDNYVIGPNDLSLMNKLFNAGTDHRKFMRMITVTMDITAPLYWWKEFDTYKVGTVANSCSTMHKIQEKEFTLDDFSHEHLSIANLEVLNSIINALNYSRERFNELKDKSYWWQMIQLLPTSYNQKRTVQLSYEVIANMNRDGIRRTHKLDEWQYLCKEVFDNLPYYKEITQKKG